MKLIQTQTITSSQPSITFNSIPQNFTDLVLMLSTRSDGTNLTLWVQFNSITSGYTNRRLGGDGSAIENSTSTEAYLAYSGGSGYTTNTFGNAQIYIPNYTAAVPKVISSDAVAENNGNAYSFLTSGLWNNTAAINSIKIDPVVDSNFIAGSTISLYGVGGVGDGYTAPKATGGVISYTPGYVVHTFTSSGTFTPTANLSNVEYLVVAGGGGGAYGGGGAGGYRSSVVGQSSGGGASAESRLALTSGTAYTVTVGAAGAAGQNIGTSPTNGGDSSFSSITSTGGAKAGQFSNSGGGANNGFVGGSGSGAGGADTGVPGGTGGAGIANQGFAGGNGTSLNTTNAGGGGGGAGAIGGNGTSNSNGGQGGTGVASSITGTSVTRAGGGSGGGSTATTGGAGGGGNGGAASQTGGAATTNTGSGGGGGGNTSQTLGGAGSSGIVIVRYPV